MRPFAQCTACHVWFTVRELLTDTSLEPLGLQFDENSQRLHFYLFHTDPSCLSAFKIPAEELLQLVSEAVPEETLHNSPRCPGHCFILSDETACGQICHYAPLRRLYLEMLENRNKRAGEYLDYAEAVGED